MLRFCPIAALILYCLLSFTFGESHGAVTVLAPTNGTCIDISPGLYKVLDPITITEQNKDDFASPQTNTTLILTAPAGFQFKAGTGTVGPTPGPSNNISSLSISVTATTITVTMSVSGTNKWDEIIISNIEVRALVYNISGNILRLTGVAGGTANINGDAPGAGINHGSLTSESATIISTIANGNWSNPAIWLGGIVPSCFDTIVIGHNVNADIPVTTRTLIVNTSGILTSTADVTVDSSFIIQGNGIYIHNNNFNAATTIFKGVESFSPTSTIQILRWYNNAVPFASSVTGNFGNLVFNQGSAWNQAGLFAPDRIKGQLTVSSGTITMDEGAGMTTSLTLSNVLINNTGALIIASGAARNLNLITGNFTDTSTSATRTVLMSNSQGNLYWTANGNVLIRHSFAGYSHSGSNPGNTIVSITGDLTIAGGSFDFNTNVSAPLTLTVTGNTTISGTPGYVRFIDRNGGALNFTTNNFYIYGGTTTELMGGNSPTGNATITVNNDFVLSGSSVLARLYNSSTSTGSLTISTGRDFIVSSGDVRLAHTNGAVQLTTGRNLTLSNSGAAFRAQSNTVSTGNVTISVTGDFENNSGTVRVSDGTGNVTMQVIESVRNNNGNFYAINNTSAINNGAVQLTCNYINFNGGIFQLYNAQANDGKLISVTVNSDINVNFLAGTDIFSFLFVSSTNNARLNLTVAYNLIIDGNFPGAYFLSSASAGEETISIGGTMMINAGDVFFVGNTGALANSHNITTTIGGDVIINGGNTRLSTGAGTASITTNGNVVITAGGLNLKFNTGSATWMINGNWIQSGGTFNIHAQNATTPNSCLVTVNGDFTMTNGTFNFDNFQGAGALAEHILNLNGANVTFGGSSIITHANNLTTNYTFGQIHFTRSGTTTYSRTSSSNEIRYVKYTINSGTLVNASSSTEGFQITSIQSATPATHNALTIFGTLDMGDKVLSARQFNNYYAQLTVENGGRYRTAHTGGLYSGNSSTASSIYGFVTTFNRVNYSLHPSSIVEYYGNANLAVTGIPNGIASTNDQKYGILEINMSGIAWSYPETSDEVFVRTSLRLTQGEFNLDNDRVTSGGGRAINIENGATITRTTGYIRSETEDGSGLVRWNITANGSYVIPFGYDASSYIPFTYQQTSGSSGIISIGTYRSLANNTPYPPTVTHVRDTGGNDNSVNTVDRFWYISVPGVATSSLLFSYASSEGVSIVTPRAQLWEPVSRGWFPPTAGQSNPTGTTTLVPGVTLFNNWWTLSSSSTPLPVELLSFTAEAVGKKVELQWSTASEINNHFFTVERSRDGLSFSALGTVDGNGNTTSISHYSFLDKYPLDGLSYYRLKQHDFDGHISYSEIKIVQINNENFSVYPNPAHSGSVIFIPTKQHAELKYIIRDLSGRVMLVGIQDTSDQSEATIDLSNHELKAGIYLLELTVDGSSQTVKLVIR
jgi:hypothetical protein